MIMTNEKLLKFLIIFLFESLVFSTIHCNDWEVDSENSYFRTLVVHSVQATGTPLYTSTCKSEIHCAWKCWIRDASSYSFHNSDFLCECHGDLEHGHTDGQTPGGILKLGRYASVTKSVKDNNAKFDVKPARSDCLELLQDNFIQDGVYVISVNNVDVNVWCNMSDGGWTVIQRRKDGTENFYRMWNDYKNGFGDPTGEHWFGLSHMHALTIEPSELHIVLKSFGDVEPVIAHVQYDSFSVGSEATAFILNSSGYSGCSDVDALAIANGMKFSTRDVDNDLSGDQHCAQMYKGAWWFRSCFRCHLNGEYYHDPNLETSQADHGIAWTTCYSYLYSLKESEMKIRRKKWIDPNQ